MSLELAKELRERGLTSGTRPMRLSNELPPRGVILLRGSSASGPDPHEMEKLQREIERLSAIA